MAVKRIGRFYVRVDFREWRFGLLADDLLNMRVRVRGRVFKTRGLCVGPVMVSWWQ